LNARSGPAVHAQGSEELFERLQAQACDILARVRDESGRDVAIAGCLPPLVASYHSEVAPAYDAALTAYRRIVAAQAEHVDLFLGETLASTAEATAAARAVLESDLPVWISLKISDDDSVTLRSGEPLAEGVAALREVGVNARLLNCSRPEAITAAWEVLAAGGGATGAYANGFTSIDGLKPDAICHRRPTPTSRCRGWTTGRRSSAAAARSDRHTFAACASVWRPQAIPSSVRFGAPRGRRGDQMAPFSRSS